MTGYVLWWVRQRRKRTGKGTSGFGGFVPACCRSDGLGIGVFRLSGSGREKISLAYLLEHAQEILDYLIEQNPGPDHTDWSFNCIRRP